MKNIILVIFFIISNFLCFSQNENGKSISYLLVDKMPRYEGGNKNIENIIYHNMIWPNEFDGQGTVLCSFVVTKKGWISNIKIEKGLCDECNNEAVRLIKLLHKWSPGMVDHQKADVKLYIPITFKITN